MSRKLADMLANSRPATSGHSTPPPFASQSARRNEFADTSHTRSFDSPHSDVRPARRRIALAPEFSASNVMRPREHGLGSTAHGLLSVDSSSSLLSYDSAGSEDPLRASGRRTYARHAAVDTAANSRFNSKMQRPHSAAASPSNRERKAKQAAARVRAMRDCEWGRVACVREQQGLRCVCVCVCAGGERTVASARVCLGKR